MDVSSSIFIFGYYFSVSLGFVFAGSSKKDRALVVYLC